MNCLLNQLYIHMEEKSYKEYLEHITTFIFDVDGVLTDGSITVTTTGEMLRTMSIKDGYALKTAVDKGLMSVSFLADRTKGYA